MDVEAEQWSRLTAAAVQVRSRAHSPYSHFPVGAAALAEDGSLVTGCNVENASYGLTLCAECGIVSQLVATGAGRIVALVCVDAEGHPLAPCGRCRQLLLEHAANGMQVLLGDGPAPITALLPQAFGPESLGNISGRQS